MGLDTSYDNISEVLSLLQRYKQKIIVHNYIVPSIWHFFMSILILSGMLTIIYTYFIYLIPNVLRFPANLLSPLINDGNYKI